MVVVLLVKHIDSIEVRTAMAEMHEKYINDLETAMNVQAYIAAT
jgi:hypothetical protein